MKRKIAEPLRVESIVDALSLLLAASNQRRALLCVNTVALCPGVSCQLKRKLSTDWISFDIYNSRSKRDWMGLWVQECSNVVKSASSSLASVPSYLMAFESKLADSGMDYRSHLERLNLNSVIPNTRLIQNLIERAWNDLGFDPEGASHLNFKLVGSRKWIGTCEIYCLMHSLGIQVKVTDFPSPTGPNKSHPALMDMVEAYFDGSTLEFETALNDQSSKRVFPLEFQRNIDQGIHTTEKLPLYFQYQLRISFFFSVKSGILDSYDAPPTLISTTTTTRGHSLTVIGIEVLNSSERNLLVLDPGHRPPAKLLTNLDTFMRNEKVLQKTLKCFRFPESGLTAKKSYQILEITGLYKNELDSTGMRKVFQTTKIE
ncbi:peptidase family C78-domain-containing protein [Obelidium mucronatum]|nr:peptidase family C78-domain-containing protein [Obelidium mucronatum]